MGSCLGSIVDRACKFNVAIIGGGKVTFSRQLYLLRAIHRMGEGLPSFAHFGVGR